MGHKSTKHQSLDAEKLKKEYQKHIIKDRINQMKQRTTPTIQNKKSIYNDLISQQSKIELANQECGDEEEKNMNSQDSNIDISHSFSPSCLGTYIHKPIASRLSGDLTQKSIKLQFSFNLKRLSGENTCPLEELKSKSSKNYTELQKKQYNWLHIFLQNLNGVEAKQSIHSQYIINEVINLIKNGHISQFSSLEFNSLYQSKRFIEEKINKIILEKETDVSKILKLARSRGESLRETLSKINSEMLIGIKNGDDAEILGLDMFAIHIHLRSKLLILHTHISKFKDHPIKKIINLFRESLISYIKSKKEQLKFNIYDFKSRQSFQEYSSNQYKKLLMQVNSEIKTISTIIMKALVYFYQFDAKKGESTIVCLYSMIIYQVLRYPIYSDLMEIMKIVYESDIRELESQFEKDCSKEFQFNQPLDEVEIGKAILMKNYKFLDKKSEIDNDTAKQTFKMVIQSLSIIQKQCSAVQKLFIIKKIFELIINSNEFVDADYVFQTIIQVMRMLGPKFVAKLYLEIKYIEIFCHQTIQMMEPYAFVAQIQTAFIAMKSGLENYFKNLYLYNSLRSSNNSRKEGLDYTLEINNLQFEGIQVIDKNSLVPNCTRQSRFKGQQQQISQIIQELQEEEKDQFKDLNLREEIKQEDQMQFKLFQIPNNQKNNFQSYKISSFQSQDRSSAQLLQTQTDSYMKNSLTSPYLSPERKFNLSTIKLDDIEECSLDDGTDQFIMKTIIHDGNENNNNKGNI